MCIVDLTARLVVIESTYSSPGAQGGVEIRNLPGRDDVCVPYHLADDWLFLRQVDGWQAQAEQRRRERLAAPPLDARAVLYGKVCEFIATECLAQAGQWAPNPPDEEAVWTFIRATHARWLLTPRDDLRGQCPRDLLVARHDHLGWDLQDRSEQWSRLGACPPGLSPDAAAYRYGGFGTHEIVIYYDLVRFLFWSCWDKLTQLDENDPPRLIVAADGKDRFANSPFTTSDETDAEMHRLEALRDEWLATPNFEDLGGRTPASVIERERQRLPEGGTGAEAAVDHDCPLCQMMADDETGVYFWGLDGCNMDDDFAFDFHHRTREEWEKERREWEEYHQKCEEERARKGTGGADSVWQRSYVNPEIADSEPALVLFGLGSRLAELTQDLKEAAADQHQIDDLNRIFGNLREVATDANAALVEPVFEKLREALAGVAEGHPALGAKYEDLERQLADFVRRLAGEAMDEDLPF